MGLIIVLGPAFYAFKDFKTPAKAAVLSLIINFLLNCIFIFGFGFSALSVALATSISSWVNIVYLYKTLKKHYEQVVSTEGMFEIGKVLAISVASAIAALAFQSFFFNTPQFFQFFKPSHETLPT